MTQKRKIFRPVLMILLAFMLVVFPVRESRADRVAQHEMWLVSDFYMQMLLPAWQAMTEQMTAVAMHQMLIVGTFFDAKHQLETQLLFQELTAQAHKDYRPSIGMCTFGTNVRSLAAAEHNARLNSFVMGRREQDRHLGNKSANAAAGAQEDREGRLEQFKARYCDKNDNNKLSSADTGLALICEPGVPGYAKNRDIDFTRVISLQRTLGADFSDNTLTGDEQDILALASYLYGHDVFNRPRKSELEYITNQQQYLEMRSVIAKRSVAEHSFNTITAMKTSGTEKSEDTAQYMMILLEQLGMPKIKIEKFLGTRPSYLAQMEILAKKIYQNPVFYTNLYDSPVNVRRQSAAMKAIGLMLDRDIYDSYLRGEALMSVLLEMKVIRKQKEVQNLMKQMKSEE